MKYLNLPFLLMLLMACSTSTKESTDDDTITYEFIVEQVFNDEGEGIEWHGEAIPNEEDLFLSFSSSGKCGDGDCGESMFMTSSHETKSIEVILKNSYFFDDEEGSYIARKYIIKPKQKMAIGCTHLCYKGKSYEFAREVVGTQFVD